MFQGLHHKASFVLATSLLGATADPWVGSLVSAVIAGVFALIGILVQSKLTKSKGVAIQSAALTAMAEHAARLEVELTVASAELARLTPHPDTVV